MRYLIQFSDKTAKRVSEADAKAIMESLNAKKPVIFKGAYLSPHYILSIKPVSRDWYDPEYVKIEQRAEEKGFAKVGVLLPPPVDEQ